VDAFPLRYASCFGYAAAFPLLNALPDELLQQGPMLRIIEIELVEIDQSAASPLDRK
jgi:hypothetical protein